MSSQSKDNTCPNCKGDGYVFDPQKNGQTAYIEVNDGDCACVLNQDPVADGCGCPCHKRTAKLAAFLTQRLPEALPSHNASESGRVDAPLTDSKPEKPELHKNTPEIVNDENELHKKTQENVNKPDQPQYWACYDHALSTGEADGRCAGCRAVHVPADYRPSKPEKPTRLVVIDHRKDGVGILHEIWGVEVESVLQDNGRTLKVFVRDLKGQE